MGLIYDLWHWLDHVTQYPNRRKITTNADGTQTVEKAQGEILQQGTPRNGVRFNNIETGIFGNSAYALHLQQQVIQLQRSSEELQGESGLVALTNTNKYPFPGSAVTVSIAKLRSSLNYRVETEVKSATGGFVEEIEVYDKQLNGFKVRLKGSATSVSLKYFVIGGLYQ